MRITTFLFFFIFALQTFSQETYTIIIDGKSFPIELDKNFTYITASGDSVAFQIQKTGDTPVVATPAPAPSTNSFIDKGNEKTYEDVMIQFAYPANFAVAKTQPANGMQQITMISGQGGGILIQEYQTINPQELTDFFLSQLVGENYAKQAQEVNTMLDGQRVNGRFATDEDGNKVVVYSYGQANQGILLALIGDDTSDALLRDFLGSFRLKF